jgi:nucleoside-diphosphate-sugar epimerase
MLGESGFYHYGKKYGFASTSVRYHNVYGPRMGFKHVIPQVVQRFIAGEEKFKIYGFNETRAFNFIEDAVAGTIGAMESSNCDGEIIHLGDMRHEITIEELVRFIGKYLGYSGEYQLVEGASGSVKRRCPDTSKATSLFGYRPQKHWQDGVRETIDWYKKYLLNGGKVYE